MECSLENDEGTFLMQSAAQDSQPGKAAASNNLDKPFGMDLSVEFGGHSNRSSVVSQVSWKLFSLNRLSAPLTQFNGNFNLLFRT